MPKKCQKSTPWIYVVCYFPPPPRAASPDCLGQICITKVATAAAVLNEALLTVLNAVQKPNI